MLRGSIDRGLTNGSQENDTHIFLAGPWGVVILEYGTTADSFFYGAIAKVEKTHAFKAHNEVQHCVWLLPLAPGALCFMFMVYSRERSWCSAKRMRMFWQRGSYINQTEREKVILDIAGREETNRIWAWGLIRMLIFDTNHNAVLCNHSLFLLNASVDLGML